MALTKYPFSIAGAFPNHKAATDRLSDEIHASPILTSLDRIDTDGDTCNVWFKNSLSNADALFLPSVVAAHSGEPYPTPVQPVSVENTLKSSDGVQKVMLVPGQPDRLLVVKGIKFNAPQDTTTVQDTVFGETRELQGSWLEVSGAEPGDYLELSIHTPDGMKLGQHGESVYIPPSGRIEQITSEGTVSFPAGFKLRITYVAAPAGATRTVFAWYRMRK